MRRDLAAAGCEWSVVAVRQHAAHGSGRGLGAACGRVTSIAELEMRCMARLERSLFLGQKETDWIIP